MPQRGWAVGYLRAASTVSGSPRLERVDRHVLGAVVLERAPDVGGTAHEHQVADEDRHSNEALRELEPEALVHTADGRLSQEQRQQEEDGDADDEAEQQHPADRHGIALAQPLIGGRARYGRGSPVGVRVAGVMAGGRAHHDCSRRHE